MDIVQGDWAKARWASENYEERLSMIVVTSWDDGYPADMKIAELLDRHGLTGTFFVCVENSEGRPVLEKAALRELDKRFEIGAHPSLQVRFNTLENQRIDEEIRDGKTGLEEILGHRVDGLAYPLGSVTSYAVKSLRKNGLRYARTTENFRFDVGEDPYRVPTTLQIFPHPKQVYIRNFIKRGHLKKRWSYFRHAMTCGPLWDTLDAMVEDCSKRDGVLHLWGHSWEIEQYDLWQELDALFSRIKQFAPVPKTVAQSIDNTVGNTLQKIISG